MKNPEDQSGESELGPRIATAPRSYPNIPNDDSRDLRMISESRTALASQVQIEGIQEESGLFRQKYSGEESSSLQYVEMTGQINFKQHTEKSKVLTEDGINPLDSKYKKALSEVSRLLKVNKDLKIELDSTKLRNVGGPEQAALIRENDELKFTIQRLETTIKELDSTNRLYTDQLNDYEAALRNHRTKSEQKIADLTSGVRAKEAELRELRQTKAALQTEAQRPNEVIFQLKMNIERHRKQQSVWEAERRNLFDQILELQRELGQGKIERQRLAEHMDTELKEQGLQLRRSLQQEIFEFKAENSNLKQSLGILTKENERLTRQIKLGYDATLDKHRDEAKLVWELTCQLQDFRQQGAKLRQALLIQEQTEAETEIIRNELIQTNHNAELTNNQNEQLRKQVAQLEQQLIHLKSRTTRSDNNFVDPIASSPTGKGLDYTRERETAQSELRLARQEAEQLRGQNHMLCAEIEELHGQVLKLTMGGDHEKSQVLLTSHALNLQGKLKEFRLKIDLLPNLKSKEHDVQRQLALLRALLGDVQASIRTVVADNQHSLHKARRYRDKLHVTHSKYDCAYKQNKKLMEKVAGYEKLVQKYEKQLQKMYQTNSIRSKVIQQTEDPAHSLTKVRDLEERFILQEKHFQQQLRTRQLEFETKLIGKKLQIDQLKEELGSFELYKNKIREFSDKIIELEALNNQYWTKLSHSDRPQLPIPVAHSNVQIVALIEKLTQRQDRIIHLEYQGARLKQANDLLQLQLREQELTSDSVNEQASSTKNRLVEAHMIIERLNQDLSTYESRLNELSKYRGYETTIAHYSEEQSVREKQVTELRILAKKLSESNATLDYQFNLCKNNLALKVQEVGQLKDQNGQLRANVESVTYLLERVRKELIEVTANLSSEKGAAESAELHFKRTIQQFRSRIATNQAEISRLRDVETQLQTERGQTISIKTQAVTSQDRILQLESQLNHYMSQQVKQQTLHTKRYEKDLQNQLEISSLRLQKQRLDKLREHLTSQIEELQQVIAKERRAHGDQINKIYAEMHQQRSHTFADISPKKDYASEQLRDQVSRLQDQIRALRSQALQFNTKYNELKHFLMEKELQTGQLQHNAQSYIREIERLRNLVMVRQEEMTEKVSKLIETEKSIKQMEYEIYNLKVQLQKLEKLKQGNSEFYQQIERLRKTNKELLVDLSERRLQFSVQNGYELRIKENLSLFVLLFVEIESLRSQLKKKELEVNESRRSSLAIIPSPILGDSSPSSHRRLGISSFSHENMNSPVLAVYGADSEQQIAQSRYSAHYAISSPNITKSSYQTDSATSIFPR